MNEGQEFEEGNNSMDDELGDISREEALEDVTEEAPDEEDPDKEYSEKEGPSGKEVSKNGGEDKSFRNLVQNLIQKHSSIRLIIPPPINQRIFYPSKAEFTIPKVPVTGGVPISEEFAIELSAFAFGPADIVSFTSADWIESTFGFHEAGTNKAWALKLQKEGTKGLITCVQAQFIKYLLFVRRRIRGSSDISTLMRPDRKTQEECLVLAMSEILWKAGDKQRATLCLLQEEFTLQNSEVFRGDGVTEKICQLNFKKQDDLTFNLKKYLYQFVENEKGEGAGAALFLYSLISSKGFEKLRSEMDSEDMRAVCSNGTLHRTMANLMITGRASPYLHNGVIHEGTEATMAKPQTGTLIRSEIGFLAWQASSKQIEVGSRLKTPSYPIWITLYEENYGILFNLNRDLMRDYHAENRFDLLYYSGKSEAPSPTTLTIDTREQKYLDPYRSPPLELLIHTKWEEASVDWNGTEPYI